MSNIDQKHLYVKDLDFSKIKENLKEYLRNQDQLIDLDFEGSNISAILDVLAYNTHYNALNTNIALSELYLDSAQDRANVVSRAAEIGYTPRGAISSHGKIKLRLENVNPTYVTPENTVPVPRGTQFRTSIDGTRYFFSTISNYQLNHIEGNTYEGEVEIYAGKIRSTHYIINEYENPERKFSLPADNIDLNLLRIYIKDSLNSTFRTSYQLVDTIINKTSEDNIYFIYDSILRRPYIQFGDGIFGNKPENHQYVEIEYIVSDEGKADGAKNFTLIDDLGGTGDSYITILERISGGAEKESVEQIKRNAYLSRYTQDRLVIEDDYVAHLQNVYPFAESVSCWGGEKHNPPTYGRVFLSIKPLNGLFLSEAEKLSVIENYIRKKSIVTTIPEIIDPEYVDIDIDIDVNYDRKSSALTLNEIYSTISNTIRNYDSENLNLHNVKFIYSNFLRKLYESDSAIQSVLTEFNLLSRLIIVRNTLYHYQIQYVNPITSLSSSEFTYKGISECYLYDDNGSVYVKTPNDKSFKVGSINYESGDVSIELMFNDAPDSVINVYTKSKLNNIDSKRNIIIGINKINVSVN